MLGVSESDNRRVTLPDGERKKPPRSVLSTEVNRQEWIKDVSRKKAHGDGGSNPPAYGLNMPSCSICSNTQSSAASSSSARSGMFTAYSFRKR